MRNVPIFPRAAELITQLNLEPHPEGGYFREIFRSADLVAPADGRGPRAALTTIYFLLPAGIVSRWHRVASDEVWHLYEGGPLEVLTVDPACTVLTRHALEASAPVCTVAASHWQSARTLGDYALTGCTVGPGFDFADFAILADDAATASRLLEKWPDLASLI
jgi:predicted cupin superfamily sugar epimerase